MKKKQKIQKKQKKFVFPPWGWSVAAFLIPVVSCIVMLALKGVYPFGDQCILKSDMYDQYCPFFYDFARKLKSGTCSVFNWNLGLGADYISTYSYYLSSPLNFLLIFVPESLIIEFMTYSIVFRIGICGWSFYRFLNYRFSIQERDDSGTETSAVALLLSTAYALSGYVAAYNWQIMWMDCIALTPLIFLGLLKMYREKKIALYSITLALAIFSNYYIAMMICIFLVFYWIALVIEEEKRSRKIWFTLRFAVCSALAGGASAVLILPTVSSIANSGSDVGAFPDTIEWYYSPLAALGRANAFTKVYAGSQYWPNIYAGVFTVLLVLVFFFNQDISRKKKMTRLVMLLFFQISFMNNILSYLWHGLRYPTWFPSRQSFLYIFLLLTIGMEGFLHISRVRKKQLLVSFGMLFFLVMLSAFAEDKEIAGEFSFRVTGLLFLLYAILCFLITVVNSETKLFLRRITLGLAFAEVILSMNAAGFSTANRVEYVSRVEELQSLLELREEGDFYRTDQQEGALRNDGSLLGYPSLSVFDTVLNIKVVEYYSNHNMIGETKYYSSSGITPIIAAMLGNRYQITKGAENETRLKTMVGQAGEYTLYENSHYLPIGFTIPADLCNQKNENIRDGINDIPLQLTGKEAYQLTCQYSQKEELDCTEITVEEDGYYYLYNCLQEIKEIKIMPADEGDGEFYETGDRTLIELGELSKGDRFLIRNSEDSGMAFDLYKADLDVIEEVFAILEKHPFILNGEVASGFEGRITVDEGEKVLFSVPADKGWRAYVDGIEIEVESYCDAFLCISPEPGEHLIQVIFDLPYFRMGVVISILCAGIMLLLSGKELSSSFRQRV